MKTLGLEGVRRGRHRVTTIPGKDVDRPRDAVNRDFTVARPNALWVAEPAQGLLAKATLHMVDLPGPALIVTRDLYERLLEEPAA